MPYRKKTFRFSEETVFNLEKLCEIKGCNQTEAIKAAIQDAIQEPAKSHNTSDSSTEALIKQLEVKDEQIQKLMESLQAEQAKTAFLLPEKAGDDGKPGFFSRLFRRD